VDLGSLLIVRVNPLQITLHQLASRQPAGFVRSKDLINGSLHDLKRLAPLKRIQYGKRHCRRTYERLTSIHSSSPLKDIFQSELHLAIVCYRGCNLPEVRAAEAPGWRTELRCIQEVERLPPKLHSMPFPDSEVFKESEIPGLLRRRIE